MVIEEEQLTKESLSAAIKEVYEHKEKYSSAMKNSSQTDAIATIVKLIQENSK